MFAISCAAASLFAGACLEPIDIDKFLKEEKVLDYIEHAENSIEGAELVGNVIPENNTGEI